MKFPEVDLRPLKRRAAVLAREVLRRRGEKCPQQDTREDIIAMAYLATLLEHDEIITVHDDDRDLLAAEVSAVAKTTF